jgi:hypothetical protein
MSNIITTNQSIEPAVAQDAYSRWFVTGREEIAAEEQEEQQIKYVYYVAANVGPVCQLELFDPIVDDKCEFQRLASQWRIERGSSSSTTEIVLCPSYQSIIGMGTKAVPMILAKMESEGDQPDHWFWALQVLTRVDPVNEEDEGDFRKMAKSWLHWASRRYVW